MKTLFKLALLVMVIGTFISCGQPAMNCNQETGENCYIEDSANAGSKIVGAPTAPSINPTEELNQSNPVPKDQKIVGVPTAPSLNPTEESNQSNPFVKNQKIVGAPTAPSVNPTEESNQSNPFVKNQ